MRWTVKIYEFIFGLMAIVSVMLIWVEGSEYIWIDRIVLFIFAIDIFWRLFKSEKKWDFIKRHPFEFVAIIPFDSIFRIARLVRLMRVLRFIVLFKRFFPTFTRILKTNSLDKMLIFVIILILVTSIPIVYIEPSITNFMDALWWAVVTTTTVGYGDISPETPLGRIIAILLMVSGIGVIGTITGSVATFFNKQKDSENPYINTIKQQLDKYPNIENREIDILIAILEKLKHK